MRNPNPAKWMSKQEVLEYFDVDAAQLQLDVDCCLVDTLAVDSDGARLIVYSLADLKSEYLLLKELEPRNTALNTATHYRDIAFAAATGAVVSEIVSEIRQSLRSEAVDEEEAPGSREDTPYTSSGGDKDSFPVHHRGVDPTVKREHYPSELAYQLRRLRFRHARLEMLSLAPLNYDGVRLAHPIWSIPLRTEIKHRIHSAICEELRKRGELPIPFEQLFSDAHDKGDD